MKALMLAFATVWIITISSQDPASCSDKVARDRGAATEARKDENDAAPVQQGTVLVLTNASREAKSVTLHFELKNNGKKPIWVSAYSETYPRGQTDRWIPANWFTPGHWQVIGADHCGTGAYYHELESGEAMRFRQGIGANQRGPIRVGVYCKEGTIWSNKIYPDELLGENPRRDELKSVKGPAK
jgi:hypothetical protein